MALGGATKKLQQIVDMAEETYKRLNELRRQVQQMRETVVDTNRRVRRLERELDDQQALVEALSRDADVDVEKVLAEAAIEEAEPTQREVPDARTDADADVAAAGADDAGSEETVGEAEGDGDPPE